MNIQVKEYDQTIVPAAPILTIAIPNLFLSDLVENALQNGTAEQQDPEGATVTAMSFCPHTGQDSFAEPCRDCADNAREWLSRTDRPWGRYEFA